MEAAALAGDCNKPPPSVASTILPARALVLMYCTDKLGRYLNVSGSTFKVFSNPIKSSMSDANIPNRGPDKAKSNKF
jgi:hypothetical protein